MLLRARAIESQCYVIAAAQAGKHNEKRESYGHSLVVDPWGKVLADAGNASPSLITAEIGMFGAVCVCFSYRTVEDTADQLFGSQTWAWWTRSVARCPCSSTGGATSSAVGILGKDRSRPTSID